MTAIPGFAGFIKVAKIGNSSPTWSSQLPFWNYEYGGACQASDIYLASGIPFADVFPEREGVTVWSFAGPSRTDVNPFNNSSGGFALLNPGRFTVGQAVQVEFTVYSGAVGLGAQIARCQCAIVVAEHWGGTARGPATWSCSLAASWSYSAIGTTDSASPLFRVQGGDTSYTGAFG